MKDVVVGGRLAFATVATGAMSRDGYPVREGTLTVASASLIDLPIRQHITSAVLIVERETVIGRDVNPIGDLASIMTLKNSNLLKWTTG